MDLAHRLKRLGPAILAFLILLVPAAHSADRHALRTIVGLCVRHWQQSHQSAPCLSLHSPTESQGHGGYALLADQKGGAHFLLIPTERILGIEDPVLLQPDHDEFFAAAWDARALIAARLGQKIQRDRIALAVNAPYSRGQDQLHIHIECAGEALTRTLRTHSVELNSAWRPLRVGLWPYRARRVLGDNLKGTDPFVLLADGLPGARARMRDYTLVVAGWTFADGPGFVVLAGKDVPGGETLLSPSCPTDTNAHPLAS